MKSIEEIKTLSARMVTLSQSNVDFYLKQGRTNDAAFWVGIKRAFTDVLEMLKEANP